MIQSFKVNGFMLIFSPIMADLTRVCQEVRSRFFPGLPRKLKYIVRLGDFRRGQKWPESEYEN